MDLQEDPAAQPSGSDASVDAEHCDLHDVGRRALNRGIEGHSLCHLAALTVLAVQVGQVPAPARHRLGVPGAPRFDDHLREVVAHAAEPREVLLHEQPRLLGRDSKLLREPIGRQPVGKAIGHCLDPTAHLGIDCFGGHPEYLTRHGRVEILAAVERSDEPGV